MERPGAKKVVLKAARNLAVREEAARAPRDAQYLRRFLVEERPRTHSSIRGQLVGAYGSNSEVIREALRGWLERDRRLAALDGAIATGLADADAGRLHSAAAVRARLKSHLRKKSRTPA
jgi:antitoxin ParD1/3/4